MKNLVIGILAHVDAGKTTLSESLLYTTGSIRKLGRVDNKDAFLDNYELERARGITIFSKQAVLRWNDVNVTLLDTPGHVDFSAEMERTLQVLDYAILVISGQDGIQGHTLTLWKLLERYHIPVFLFVNKMDQERADKSLRLEELKMRLEHRCVDFNDVNTSEFNENVALCEEALLEDFLETGVISEEQIQTLIYERKLFPCFFGSALKQIGVEELIAGLERYTIVQPYPEEFGAKVYKISRDEQGNRLTFLKVTGGSLCVRSLLSKQRISQEDEETIWEEKVNQIRIYSGEKYETVNEAKAGCICAVTGLTNTYPGECLGNEVSHMSPSLEPVLTYQIMLPEGCDARSILPKLKQLEEEDPLLHVIFHDKLQEIQVQVMGEVQIEILKSLILDRFSVEVEFGEGNIVYKETIRNKVEGVGHFEPLRHYAEVHLILEPLDVGSGLQFALDCSEDDLNRNWQRLILTHLEEKEHRGVLTGSAITDMRITLVDGRAHPKHTEGGDFRQATYRAVRQGLKEADSVLLEPYYEFRLEIPEGMVGRAMVDLERRNAKLDPFQHQGDIAVLTGSGPVVLLRDYHKEVIAYTKGCGRFTCTLKGYQPCHNEEEVLSMIGYDSERDLENPTGSVFCAHGAGFLVSWDEVKKYMHLESKLEPAKQELRLPDHVTVEQHEVEEWIGVDEVDAILNRTYNANKKEEGKGRQGYKALKIRDHIPVGYGSKSKAKPKEQYLLVDGYNIIFAWEELKELAQTNIDAARGKLMDILCNYQGIRKCHLILVFDAYKVQQHKTEIIDYHNIHVVYTKEAETADQYIEKFTQENVSKFDVTVATSDGLEQIIIRGQGGNLLSARDLKQEVELVTAQIKEEVSKRQTNQKNYLMDSIDEEVAKHLNTILKDK